MRKFLLPFWRAAVRLQYDGFTYRASALAFTTLLSIVPLVSVFIYLVSVFPAFNNIMQLARNYVVSNFIPTSSNAIVNHLQNFSNTASRMPTLSIVFLLVTAVMLVITIEHTLNDAWVVPQRKQKPLLFFIYWLTLVLTPLLIGASVFMSSYLFSLKWFTTVTNAVYLQSKLVLALPFFLNAFMLSLLYIIAPNHKVKLMDGLVGGMTAALLFEIAKKAFAYYIKAFPSYQEIYGALAVVPIFLIWLYISWMIVLYGALLVHARYECRKKGLKK